MIALFNLYAIKYEVNKVKQAIREGRLWEYVIKKARAHPKLFETIQVLTDNSKAFIDTTPKFKEKAVFLFSPEDQFRPEILSFHSYVRNFKSKKKIVVITRDTNQKPAYVSSEYRSLKKKFKDPHSIQFCNYNQFLGIIPIEISDVFPASHYVMTRNDFSPEDFPLFKETWEKFFTKNKFESVYISKNDPFLQYFKKLIPKGITKKQIPE